MGIKMSVKKLGLLFGLLGVFTGIFAGDDNSCRKESKDKKMQDCSSLCFAGPQLEEDNSFNVMGAAIYGVANAQANEIALFSTNRNLTAYPEGGQGLEPYENPSWGFKVGLGYRISHDDWKFEGRYTWFKSTYSGSYESAYGGVYFPSFYANMAVDVTSLAGGPFGGGVTPFTNLQYGTYTLLQALNVYLVRPTLYTALLEISPYFGVDYINTMRRMTISFTNDAVASPIYINGGFYRTYDKNRFWGVGPMVGINSNWYLGYDVGLYADGYFAVTYGCANSYSQTAAYRPSQSASPAATAAISNSLYQYAPHMNIQLGFNWSHTFDSERAALSFRAGYESQYFFQVNKTIFNSTHYFIANGAGIGLQNLVLQLQVDF